MGILVNGAMLATALRRAKRQPTRLLRYLMVELFSRDELRCSTVRGKKGELPALDQDIMNAILCKLLLCIVVNKLFNLFTICYHQIVHLGFTMAKGDEWGLPVTEEALVRQANEKCYSFRKK